MTPTGHPSEILRPFAPADEAAVVELWRACDLVRPWNDPHRDIARKLASSPALFIVADAPLAPVAGGRTIIGSAMAGWDGHRGWINYLAVDPSCRRGGLGRRLVADAEARLAALGCPKINLQVRETNAAALGFWRAIGYAVDPVVSLGRRLVDDELSTERTPR